MTLNKLAAITGAVKSDLQSLKAKLTTTRNELESDSSMKYPLKSSRRAICYAAKIYNFATDGGTMELDKIDYYLWLVNSGNEYVRKSSVLLTAERAYTYIPSAGASATRGEQGLSLKDTRPGLVIIRVEGKAKKGEWNQTFVVFRGSRGALQGSDNTEGAGWTAGAEGARENVDWTANFDDEQVRWPFGGAAGDVKVHRGFLSIYSSLREVILSKLRGLNTDEIIVTGHSLGGGLTTLCAYDLCHSLPAETIVSLSFNAPRAGNEAFARDFNRCLADQTYTSASDDGGFRQSFRFDQRNDPVTFGLRHSSKFNYVSDYKALPENRRADLSEKTVMGKLGVTGGRRDADLEKQINAAATAKVGATALTKDSDFSKPFYHVNHKKTISFGGMHSFTVMLDNIVGSGSAAALGIHD